MKKTKLFEVSLINKAYSRVLRDTTRFYTSDTALEIGFKLAEPEYSFDSGVVLLLNDEDQSLVVRDLAREGAGFIYTLEDDIIEHYGNWAAQPKFEKDGETYVSSPVDFTVHNDLYNNRPPKLTDVNTWKNLRTIADGLISDMRSELEVLEAQELEIKAAEAERQSAELSRIENENQRKIDHANRSAELAGKANKKQEDWITPTLVNAWVGGASNKPRFRKDDFGNVYITGTFAEGSGTIFTLPQGYRPIERKDFAINAGGGFGILRVSPTGVVNLLSGQGTYIVADNVNFSVD